MCITTNDGAWIRDAYDAREFLEGHGFNKWDVDEFGGMIQPLEYVDLEYKLECLRSEFKSYEASLDAAHGLFNELLSLCDELAYKARTKEGLKLVLEVKHTLERSEVF